MKNPIKTDEIIEELIKRGWEQLKDKNWDKTWLVDNAIQLTQSKIISIIDKRIEELKLLADKKFAFYQRFDTEKWRNSKRPQTALKQVRELDLKKEELESLKLSLSEKGGRGVNASENIGEKSSIPSENNGRSKEVKE